MLIYFYRHKYLIFLKVTPVIPLSPHYHELLIM
jgi:hypothetical protein